MSAPHLRRAYKTQVYVQDMALRCAAHDDAPRLLRLLEDGGVRAALDPDGAKDTGGRCALHHAAARGDAPLVAALLQLPRAANPFALDDAGQPPLLYALRAAQWGAAQALVEAMQVRVRGGGGRRALSVVCASRAVVWSVSGANRLAARAPQLLAQP